MIIGERFFAPSEMKSFIEMEVSSEMRRPLINENLKVEQIISRYNDELGFTEKESDKTPVRKEWDPFR